jgi:hypothetical protein
VINKLGFDQDALVQQFAQASAQQGEALRQGVRDATLQALQGRELTRKNIKAVLTSVTEAATQGAAANPLGADAVEPLLAQAFDGMDSALRQAVEANRRALQQLVTQGLDLQAGPLKKAVDDLEKLEDTFFASVSKAIEGTAGQALQSPWSHVLDAVKVKGTGTGADATATVQQLTAQTQAALRDSRRIGLKASQALLDSYSALASGVLIGMSEALGAAAPAAAPAAAAKKAPRKAP